MKLDNYILNSNKTLSELIQYGKIDGGGNYSIEYAYGNYITFNPNDYKFRGTGGWYSSRNTDYQIALKNKIEYLLKNEIILENKGE